MPHYPHCQLSIDEAMIPFKGRSTMKQYLPLKPVKRGFKVWAISDATNGYMYDFNVYTGATEGREMALGEKVVLAGVYKRWTGLLDWNAGLEYWTDTAHAHENTTHSIRKRSSAASQIVGCEPRAL